MADGCRSEGGAFSGYCTDHANQWRPRHPWCLRCPNTAHKFGIACDWHWGVLSEATRAAIIKALLARHPRGGGAKTIAEGLLVTAYYGNARREWTAWDAFEEAEAEETDLEESANFDTSLLDEVHGRKTELWATYEDLIAHPRAGAME